mmetsp:Transcript_107688/g.304630  ORF Transcript_107688/g.304630 Transcript_107688/m.304630 type:complete len:290 (+) Transcript_107688:149-1018(+)
MWPTRISVHLLQFGQVHGDLVLDRQFLRQLLLLLLLLLPRARLVDLALPPDRRSFLAHVCGRHIGAVIAVDLELSVLRLLHDVDTLGAAALTLVLRKLLFLAEVHVLLAPGLRLLEVGDGVDPGVCRVVVAVILPLRQQLLLADKECASDVLGTVRTHIEDIPDVFGPVTLFVGLGLELPVRVLGAQPSFVGEVVVDDFLAMHLQRQVLWRELDLNISGFSLALAGHLQDGAITRETFVVLISPKAPRIIGEVLFDPLGRICPLEEVFPLILVLELWLDCHPGGVAGWG